MSTNHRDLIERMEKAIELGRMTGAMGKSPTNIYALTQEALDILKKEQGPSDPSERPHVPEQRRAIQFTYTNYRGETSVRTADLISIRWGHTEWHPEDCVLLKAFDLDKNEIREFALKDCDFTKTE